MKRIFLKLAALAAIGTIVSACGGSDDPAPAPAPTGTIVEVATGSGLTSLVAAATKADLVGALSSSTATLTVFAPTDAAFKALATQLGFTDTAAMVTALSKEDLAKILSYHVLPAKKSAADLTSGGATQDTIYKFEDVATKLNLTTTSGVVIKDAVLTDAKVTKADVAATNGVVHVIDKVLVPPGVLNVVQMAQANPVFSSLVGAVVKADLVTALSAAGPFTVFAPTDPAFKAIETTVAGLTTAQLSTVLRYHVLGTTVLAKDIPFGTAVATLATPQTITITAGTAPVIATIADAAATTPPSEIKAVDVRASNGVIHVIDKVLIPSLTAN
jgi:uncharacterized surface protein with fasciclin (FAS1) repeats